MSLDRELERLGLSAAEAPGPEEWRVLLERLRSHDEPRPGAEGLEAPPEAERDRLRESERQLAEAQELAQLGSWEWDVASNVLRWSDELYRIYGVEPSAFGGGYEDYLGLIHPEDREHVEREVGAAYRTGESFVFDHRIVRPDGAVRTLHCRGKVVVDEAGAPIRMVGTGQDVTEARRIEVELRQSGERIVSEAAAMVGTLDAAATLQSVTAAVRRALGADRTTCYVHTADQETVAAVYTTETDPTRRGFLEKAVGMPRRRMPIWDYLLSQPDPFFVVEDIAAESRIPPRLADALGAGAFLGIRLEHPSVEVDGAPALLGSIFCSWRHPRELSATNRSDARGLANLAALALANARLHSETIASVDENRSLADEQAALRRVATAVAGESSPQAIFSQVAEEVAGLLGVQCGLVARYEDQRAIAVGSWGEKPARVGTVFSLRGEGALAQISRSGQAARVSDYAALAGDSAVSLARLASYRSAVGAPVRVGGRLWGAVLAATTGTDAIPVDAERRMSDFADLVALAIANALAAEQAQRQARIHRAVLETAHDAFVAIDAAGVITDWNPQAETTFGWTRDEAVGRGLVDIVIPPRHRQAYREGLDRFLVTGDDPLLGERVERSALHRDGHEFPVEVTVSALQLDGRYRFTAFVRDISERKRAERYVGAQHAVTRVLAESPTLEEATPGVLQALGQSMGWSFGALWTVDSEAGLLRCDDVWEAPELDGSGFDDLSRQATLASGIGLPGRVWRSGEPAWIEDVLEDDNFPRREAARAAGLRGAIALPILSRGEVLGVIELLRRETGRPDPDLLAMVGTIGSQLGQFFERKRAEREADRLKDEFFALVSHELRTPLASIIGYLEVLVEDEEDDELVPDQRLRFLGVIGRNARRLERLVGDLLFVAHLEQGALGLKSSSLDLARLAEEAIEVARPMAERKGISLTLACEPIPAVVGDPGRLGQSLDNLISNALKFTPDGGQVDVRLHSRDGRALIEVQDTGVGIPAAEQERLFQRFFRASTATERAIPGVGLGLTIVKAIVEAHGGVVAVESEEGRGSAFRLELPLEHPIAEPLKA